jgi:hypothetical protein
MRIALVLCLVLLSGCSSMKLGSFAYCAHDKPCKFESAK